MMWKQKNWLLFSRLLMLIHSQTTFRKGICLFQVGLFLKCLILKSQWKQTSYWFLMDTSLQKRGYSAGINKKLIRSSCHFSFTSSWSQPYSDMVSFWWEKSQGVVRGSMINCCMVGTQGYKRCGVYKIIHIFTWQDIFFTSLCLYDSVQISNPSSNAEEKLGQNLKQNSPLLFVKIYVHYFYNNWIIYISSLHSYTLV